MKKRKILVVALLLMTIGFATVATTLYINGNVLISGDQDAFDGDVIFINAYVEDGDANISQDGKTITFVTTDLKSLHQISTLEYTVTNNSTQYDANVEVECEFDESVSTENQKYISWENTLTNFVEARSSEDGTVDVELISVTDIAKEIKIACTLSVTPGERETEGTGDVVNVPENLIRGIAKLNNNGNISPLSSGNLVFFSDNHLESAIGVNGDFEVSGLENGSHEVYYMGNIDPSELTKEEIRTQATGYARFATSTTQTVIELICINNKCPDGTTFMLDDIEIEETVAYKPGDIVSIDIEKFHVVKDNGDTVTLLADYNLGNNYRQTENDVEKSFSDNNGWEYTPGPKDIDIQAYDGNVKTYVNNYVAYLRNVTNATDDDILTGDLISVTELIGLGCRMNADYSVPNNQNDRSCEFSSHASWLVNGQVYWTRSVMEDSSISIWVVSSSGDMSFGRYEGILSIRPEITISKSLL